MADLTGPLDAHALHQGQTLFLALPILLSGERIERIYDHWTGGHYDGVETAYNVVITLADNAWLAVIATSPHLNAVQVSDAAPYAAHTYLRNSHAIGIAVNGMCNATSADFGLEPVQMHELEVLCAANAAVALKYRIDIAGQLNGEPTIMTHAEAAIADDYAWEKWDLERLRQSGVPLSVAHAVLIGDLIRARSRAYKIALPAHVC